MQTSVYAMAETVVAVFCALLLVPSSPRRPHRMGGLPMTTCLCGTVLFTLAWFGGSACCLVGFTRVRALWGFT